MNEKNEFLPFVSICTPTFNRRPFIPMMLKCFDNYNYPKDKMEWIIIDDGTDKIEDLVSHIPQVKYFKFEKKMTLGKKRNLAHQQCKGEYILYMDDDDYYPPERVYHAIETLRNNPNALCSGSSIIYTYFKHIGKMIKFGPYGANHSTAATFAFKKELLKLTSFDDNACVAEEKHFLKNYTIPFVQLDPMKSILVFSHIHNSFDKKLLLKDQNDFVNVSTIEVNNFIKDDSIKEFFMKDIDDILDKYQPGKIENKPDVIKQIHEIKVKRDKMIDDYNKGELINRQNTIIVDYEGRLNQMNILTQELTIENGLLKDKVNYYDDKIKKLVQELIFMRKNVK